MADIQVGPKRNDKRFSGGATTMKWDGDWAEWNVGGPVKSVKFVDAAPPAADREE